MAFISNHERRKRFQLLPGGLLPPLDNLINKLITNFASPALRKICKTSVKLLCELEAPWLTPVC